MMSDSGDSAPVSTPQTPVLAAADLLPADGGLSELADRDLVELADRDLVELADRDLSGLVDADLSGLSASGLLEAARRWRTVANRARAAELAVVAHMDAHGTTSAQVGQQTVQWLQTDAHLTATQARSTLRDAAALTSCPEVRRAFAAGRIHELQARAMARALAGLPQELSAAQRAAIEAQLVTIGADQSDREIPRLLVKAVEQIAPKAGAAAQDELVRRGERHAHQQRALQWWDDRQGSMFFRLRVPTLEGRELVTRITGAVRALRRDRAGSGSPTAPATCAAPSRTGSPASAAARTPSFAQAMAQLDQDRADAILGLLHNAPAAHRQSREARPESSPGAARPAPKTGAEGVPEGRTLGARPALPRLNVLIDYDKLVQGIGSGELLDTGHPVSAHRIRQIACDAEVLPVVLGGSGEVLDLGRGRRVVSAALRHGLHLRDRGCAFPGCEHLAQSCEAHHIVPWARGGPTDLSNLVLLCPHHHGLVEPTGTHPDPRRWEVRMGADQVPEFLRPLPRSVRPATAPDSAGRPADAPAREVLRHSRYALMHPRSPSGRLPAPHPPDSQPPDLHAPDLRPPDP